ncbi:MAG: oxidoreductase [Bacteroidetes bacterium]|nr:Gfo/Idh/MocA family oxidoreductase [Bacteroidia bacterium]PCH68209.1 MAG: oxidoreductase [Bacteroidota bacterium]
MSKVRFGILGCADIAKRKIIPAILASTDAELICVASRDKNKGGEFGKTFNCIVLDSYDQLIQYDEIDVVYIPLPNSMHCEWAIKAAENGKHVLCEKSLALNLQEAEKMVNAAKANNVVLFEAFVYQFHPQHKQVKEIVKSGEIGDVKYVNIGFGFPEKDFNIRYVPELGGGALLDVGTYGIHFARNLFDQEPTDIKCNTTIHKKYKVDWSGNVIMRFSDAVVNLYYAFGVYYQNFYEIVGTKGRIRIDPAFSIPPNLNPCIEIEVNNEVKTLPVDDCDQFFEEVNYFTSLVDTPNSWEIHYKDMIGQANTLDTILANF